MGEHDTIQYADRGFASLMAFLWVAFSIFYMSLSCTWCRNLFDESWEKRGEMEIMQWDRCQQGFHTFSQVNDQECEVEQPSYNFKRVLSSSRFLHVRDRSKSFEGGNTTDLL